MAAAVLVLVIAVVAVAIASSDDDQTTAAPKTIANKAFTSAPSPEQPATVWAIGDGADGRRPASAAAQRVVRARPDRLLYLGDVYESGTAREFRENYARVYGRLARRTLPTPGNHEWAKRKEGYDRYWRSVTGARTPPWYSVRVGGWELISLNSEAPHGAGSPQLRWLRAQLEGASGTCRLAFWHRPRFSAGRHGDQRDTAPLWNELRGHAALVLGGHDHNLQRLRPVDGMVQVVTGAGGRERYEVNRPDRRIAFATDRDYGAVRLDLEPGRATLRFVSAKGRVLDSSSVGCER